VKQLHLSNIANVAYGYAKILRAAGREADVLCYDLLHILSLPEWMDGEFEVPIQDEWNPPLDDPRIKAATVTLPPWYRRIRSGDFWISNSAEGRRWDCGWVDVIVRASERYGPRWAVRPEDVLAYRPLVEALQTRFFANYDIVFGYAMAAVPLLLASRVPHVAVEIGTLRDTFNIDSPLGRLLALAYRTAPHTIITNADCRKAAETLELASYSYMPHPVDEDVYRPLPVEERETIRRSLCSSRYLVIAPARQSWDVKANHKYLQAFAELVRGGASATLLISEWGPDVGRARGLLRELGIADSVKWFSPAPERRLAKMFAAADLVLDQFGAFGTFGLIAPKAMAAGTPCLLSFDPGLHSWCFEQPPPLVAASTPSEIFQAMRKYLTKDVRHAAGMASRQWILKYHCKAIIAGKMQAIVDSVTEAERAKTGFDALREQELAMGRDLSRQSPASQEALMVRGSPLSRAKRRIVHVRKRLQETIVGLRYIHSNRRRLAELEEKLDGALKRLVDTTDLVGRLDEATVQMTQLQQRLSNGIESIGSQISQVQDGVMSAFDLMGKNRLEDRTLLTSIRNDVLQDIVRSRLSLPIREGPQIASRPRLSMPLLIDEARSRLKGAAPLNWPLYVECLDRGIQSYESFPPGSCSTSAHPQAELFRAFLRPYLRGHVLDVGCGPQPLPWYLSDYPVEGISGIDPISEQRDHPFFFVAGFGEYLPWEDAQFDVVVSGGALDHYYLLDQGLKSAFRVLRPGGHFVAMITEFAGAPPYDPSRSSIAAPYDVEHLFHIDRAWFLPLMAGLGYVLVEILHFELPFNYLFMSFERPAQPASV
jgi:SAM-dependent methyltransferase/glycosyltransferase involved in cell wall biosynthesis